MSDNRKTQLVNLGLQKLIILSMVACAITGGLITFIAQYLFFNSFQSAGLKMGLSPEHLFFRFLDQQASMMNWIVLGLIFIFAVVFAFLGLKLSHRIAGPLHRLETEMKNLSEGKKVEPLKFREGDFFKPLADTFNNLCDKAK